MGGEDHSRVKLSCYPASPFGEVLREKFRMSLLSDTLSHLLFFSFPPPGQLEFCCTSTGILDHQKSQELGQLLSLDIPIRFPGSWSVP